MFDFGAWTAEITALAWLTVAFVAAILEVSIPHFGSAFVGAGAVAAAAVAFFGFSVTAQFATFVAVMVASLLGLRSRLVKMVGGRGVPSRTEPLIGKQGLVTHDIDSTTGTGRVTVGGEDWAARSLEPISAGTKVRVAGADGIVLEVVRA
jgi:membrane protein implicated in regulation of membrane protease activity